MDMTAEICLEVSLMDESLAGKLNEGLFQVHVIDEHRIKLIPVRLFKWHQPHCPVIIGGEACGEPSGHAGKHRWASGD